MVQFNTFSVPVTDQAGLYLVQVTVITSYKINAPELNMKIYMVVIHCLCPICGYKKKLFTF